MIKLLSYKAIQLLLALLIGLGAGAVVYRHFNPTITKTQNTETVRTVVVETPVLTEKTITKVIKDPRERELISTLLKENNKLKLEVGVLISTVAELRSEGSGEVVKVEPLPEAPPLPPEDDVFSFKDWQLEARFTQKAFNYRLRQQFNIIATIGKTKDGEISDQVMVKLFQVGKDGENVAVPVTTTAILANPRATRFMVSPRLQAGLGVMENREVGGIAAVQWLKRGKSTATEDTRWAFASPAVFVNRATREIGVLPISFNFGTLPHSPFTNLWLSPFVDKHKKTGLFVTATF